MMCYCCTKDKAILNGFSTLVPILMADKVRQRHSVLSLPPSSLTRDSRPSRPVLAVSGRGKIGRTAITGWKHDDVLVRQSTVITTSFVVNRDSILVSSLKFLILQLIHYIH